MNIWWCEVHKTESTNQLDAPEDQSGCWLYMDFPEKPDGPCRMVEKRLVSPSSLVIEKDADDEWPDAALSVVLMTFSRVAMRGYVEHPSPLLDALASQVGESER